MGASASQLRLMDSWAWFVAPSTGRSVYGAAPSTGATPATSRLTGPYRARLQLDERTRHDDDYDHHNPTGAVLVATTTAPARTVIAVLVAETTAPTAGRAYPVSGVRTYRDDVGVHHVTCALGRSQ